ncbi:MULTISPECIES: aminotransferase class I/II-fold pyridoxal phosphate-dependent enzyme [Dyadobacter]|uniref:Aminotransferase class I/II-fold pyridoxal phosphate-dependent enzyme n=1 Tax=Dyadobacter psychrotolerans TaxID=2541721 RepID=A0A4R5DME9_9BACT|nr:aminotransferase class I/II-fold pyridoxal phosphate-dependent enzyme [Dyadobacter psychrotolerans]TDE13220.1 aminotransferase class I/II-fold pyridoxal phosphate-dependent enzyme [Dyadobacter psychrotolerans]
MNIDFTKASFRDFENIPGLDAIARAEVFYDFLGFMKNSGHMNYRLVNQSGCGPEMDVLTPQSGGSPGRYVSFVSNDYLGFTQHPLVKKAVIGAIENYGTGAGASPLIGGHFSFHQQLEEKIAAFFGRSTDSAVIYTTGYTANSASLQSLLLKEDIAIVDTAVHASVYEGCLLTNRKSFLHNDIESLERILKDAQSRYRTKMVIIDGVYSQDGDIAPLDKIRELTRRYGAYLMVDDAHGIGVLGKTGRGAMELYGIMDQVDFITGTFSKTFAGLGGYVIAPPKVAAFLKFQSRQHIFSATSTPAVAGVIKAIELIDQEPHWRAKLAENIAYFKNGLISLGMDVGSTQSAIIPVKIGNPHKTSDTGTMLLKAGIYTNPILYPAVAKKNARIRMSLMATHTREHLDKALNAFEDIDKVLKISIN